MLSVTNKPSLLSAVMLTVVHADCYKSAHFADFGNAECYYAEWHNAEWRSTSSGACKLKLFTAIILLRLNLKFLPGPNVIELFTSVINEYLIISYSVCPMQNFPA